MVSSRAILATYARAAAPTEEPRPSAMSKACCGCCSLKSGTLSCGIVSLVISLGVIVLNGSRSFYADFPENDTVDRGITFNGIVNAVVSAFCVYGASKESRYSLLPWLFVTAITITSTFMVAIYYILFGCFDFVVLGLAFLAIAGLSIYGWVCVASYYSELRDKASAEDDPRTPPRTYINPEAVTNPAAFSGPPSYSVAVEEKPPSYEEAQKRAC